MYCTKCGELKIKEPTGRFLKETGEKEFMLVCPADPCGHDGHRYVPPSTEGLSFIAKLFLPYFECKRCGKKYQDTYHW